MSRTVSFRCSEELDEYLEREAERRMTTKSTVAQMIVAEYFREQVEGSEVAEQPDENSPTDEKDGSGDSAGSVEETGERELMVKHSDKWYEPDSEKYDYAVPHPERDSRKYYKTERHAANRLRKLYE